MIPEGHYPNLGETVEGAQIVTSQPSPRHAQTIIWLLAGCVALMMTGLGIIIPVFARRLGEMGAGVEALSLMFMAFALAQFLSAPLLGSLADRAGRKPVILLALAAFAATNLAYLWAPTPGALIAVRAFGGALTAGLFPASMGVVADLVAEEERAQWIGIVMGGYGAGFILGPVLGGILYDAWGFAMPFVVSAALALVALLSAVVLIPETQTQATRFRDALRRRRTTAIHHVQRLSFWASLPRPLYILATLLFVGFVESFCFAFVEPQMVFHVYDELGWSTLQFGLVIGAYSLSMVLGQMLLGRASDRFGRRPVIVLGVVLASSFYFGLVAANFFYFVLLAALVSGVGEALMAPAQSAYLLDITGPEHRARVLGLGESALSLGGVLGPLLTIFAIGILTPHQVFIAAALLTLFSALMARLLLKGPGAERQDVPGTGWLSSESRCLAAQASLRGIVLTASAARRSRSLS